MLATLLNSKSNRVAAIQIFEPWGTGSAMKFLFDSLEVEITVIFDLQKAKFVLEREKLKEFVFVAPVLFRESTRQLSNRICMW